MTRSFALTGDLASTYVIAACGGTAHMPPDRTERTTAPRSGAQERVSGRFERAASTEHHGGFGLGLWLAREGERSVVAIMTPCVS